jgi:acyl-CoA thioesterase
VSRFDDDTSVIPVGEDRWRARLDGAWNIGDIANGGYAMTPVLRVLRTLSGHPDPISVTAHFLRPSRGGTEVEIGAGLIRRGRTTATARGDLCQDKKLRLTMVAAFADLSVAVGAPGALGLEPPAIPSPDECLDRSGLEQGVDLPILSRVDVRIRPEHAVAEGSSEAVLEGWIRLADGSEPSVLTLPLFADAFPPALYPLFGRIGWAPTIELTVHVRRRPAPGWIQARFECDDLHDGRMIESGCLWDSTGALVARSRQVGLMLTG